MLRAGIDAATSPLHPLVRTLIEKRGHSLKNGALIGAAIGALGRTVLYRAYRQANRRAGRAAGQSRPGFNVRW